MLAAQTDDAFRCSFGGEPAVGSLLVDPSSGWNYSVSVRGAGLPTLRGAGFRTVRGGRWLSNTDGLVLKAHETLSGSDGNGEFTGIALEWGESNTSSWRWVTSFRCYQAGPLVFEQAWPNGSDDGTLSASLRSRDAPSTAFPSFATTDWNDTQLVTFAGQNAARTTQLGRFAATYTGGYAGGPLALFSADQEAVKGAVVLSPLSSFMVTEHGHEDFKLNFGIQGMLSRVPPGFSAEFVLSPHVASGEPSYEHAGTVAAAFMRWGDALLNAHGGVRTPPDASRWISELGYSTTGVFHSKIVILSRFACCPSR